MMYQEVQQTETNNVLVVTLHDPHYTFFLIRTNLIRNTEAEIAQKNTNELRTDRG